jgi:hypothetical protein
MRRRRIQQLDWYSKEDTEGGKRTEDTERGEGRRGAGGYNA